MILLLIIFSSVLLGVTLGGAVCIRYLRQEMTARIGPTMDLVLLKLDNTQSAVNLTLTNWQAELYRNPSANQQQNRRIH